MNNQFQILDTVIKSRLLSFDDNGYENLLEMDIDSFRKRYKDASDEKLDPIMDRFSKACESLDALSPQYMITPYIKASDVFNSVDFDWGKNKQLASRKKFCIWMFRQAYMNNPDLHNDPYSATTEDWELFKLFKPDSEDDREDIDIVFTLLLSFQVIRPFGSGSMRALKYSSPLESNENMVKLLQALQKELPTFGILKNLRSIEIALNTLNDAKNDNCLLPPAALWGLLNNIACDLNVDSSPAELLDSHVEHNGYVMRGIWIDDGDDLQKRFWVFPNNMLMAFCFELKNNEWVLSPYEFAFTKLDYEFEFDKTCVIVTSKGNEEILTKGKVEDDEWVRLTYELGDRDEEGRFQTIRFELESGHYYPQWMNWRCFKRLPLDHNLTKKYMEVIDKIYHESEMLRGFDFRNIGTWLTDSHDCLVGLDSEFLYLSDIALDKGGYLERIDGQHDYPLYEYHIRYAAKNPGLSLFGLEISERQPMYVVPRDSSFYAELDKRLNRKSLVKDIPNKVERLAFLRRYEDFKDTVMATEYKDQVTIYKDLPRRSPAILCFNQISRTFIIDEIVEWFGVRKFTSREAMASSDIFKWKQRLP